MVTELERHSQAPFRINFIMAKRDPTISLWSYCRISIGLRGSRALSDCPVGRQRGLLRSAVTRL